MLACRNAKLKNEGWLGFFFKLILGITVTHPVSLIADQNVFELTLSSAEQQALNTSHRLKSFSADEQAAKLQSDAQFANLLPKLSLQGSYNYYANVPTISLAGSPPIPF